MKKLIYYLIFLLALVMMLLASSACRSPKTMTHSHSTTDSLTLSLKDSTTHHLSFTFDSLELWFPALQTSPLASSEVPNLRSSFSTLLRKRSAITVIPHHLVVYGGKLSSNSIHSVSQDSIFIKTTQDTKSTKPRSSPLLTPHFSLLILFALLAFAISFLILKTKNKALS